MDVLFNSYYRGNSIFTQSFTLLVVANCMLSCILDFMHKTFYSHSPICGKFYLTYFENEMYLQYMKVAVAN
jgi:hypothetical protein